MTNWVCDNCGTTGTGFGLTCGACGARRTLTPTPGRTDTPRVPVVDRVPTTTPLRPQTTTPPPHPTAPTPEPSYGHATGAPGAPTANGGMPPPTSVFPTALASGYPPHTVTPKSHWGIGVTVAIVVIALTSAVVAVLVTRHSASSDSRASGREGQAATATLATTTSVDPNVTADASTPVISTSPTAVVDPDAAALDQLNQAAASDQASVDALVGRWVPQIDSKAVGIFADGQTWTLPLIFQNYQHELAQFPTALLLRSDTYQSFKPGYWVVIVNHPTSNPDDALAWCVDQGIDGQHCYAKLVTNDPSVSPNSKLQ